MSPQLRIILVIAGYFVGACTSLPFLFLMMAEGGYDLGFWRLSPGTLRTLNQVNAFTQEVVRAGAHLLELISVPERIADMLSGMIITIIVLGVTVYMVHKTWENACEWFAIFCGYRR